MVLECVIVKLLSVVRDKDLWDSKKKNDAFPDKASDIFLHDSGQWFGLNPFGEVVDLYNKDLELQYGHREGSHYVQSPLGEWPEGIHWCKFLSWLSHDIAEALAFFTRLHIGLGVFLHSRPVVSNSYQYVNQ